MRSRLAIYGTRVNPRVGMEALVGSRSLQRIEDLAEAGPVERWATLGNVWAPGEVPVMTGPAARQAVQRAVRDASDQGCRRLVLLGAYARDVLGVPAFGWVTRDPYGMVDPTDVGVAVAWSPHPSGLSRWWNVYENREAAARFWKATAAVR